MEDRRSDCGQKIRPLWFSQAKDCELSRGRAFQTILSFLSYRMCKISGDLIISIANVGEINHALSLTIVGCDRRSVNMRLTMVSLKVFVHHTKMIEERSGRIL